MGKLDALWELQCLDERERALRWQLDNLAVKGEVAELEARIARRRQELLALSHRLVELERIIERKEEEGEEAERQRRELERRMYGRGPASARELDKLQGRLTSLQKRRRDLEEGILALMLEQDTLEAEQAKTRAALGGLEAELARKKVILAREAATLEEELALVPAAREKILSRLEAGWLDLYLTLSLRTGGQAVAAVRGDLCLGCHLSLPTHLASRIVDNERLQTCPNCGRILYYQGKK